MTSRQTRLATACQQLLALAAVVALLLPAANVVSLDVIGDSPTSASPAPSTDGNGGRNQASALTSAQQAEAAKVSADEPATDASQSSTVAAAPSDAAVTEYDLTAEATQPEAEVPGGTLGRTAAGEQETSEPSATTGAEDGELTPGVTGDEAPAGTQTTHPAEQAPARASTEQLADGRTQLTAAPQSVTDFGTVGVTWDAGQAVGDDAIAVQVRTQTDGSWSDWTDLDYHDEHGPDAGTAEAANIRPGTDPLVVGRVDEVQVRTQTDGQTPAGLRLAVVEADDKDAPTAVESPAIDTATLPTPESATGSESTTDAPAADGQDVQIEGATEDEAAITLQAAAINKATKPVIYSRAQWGANERIRDASSLRYGTIQGGFVHHTVNGNDYSRDEVPGILRSIYSYHVQSRGWSDIGYNFLIDRFGRIWEGRYGGVAKAVVGAHTLNYNDYAFAASAIGNYDIAKPSEATVNAYAALFAWKLGANNVAASAGRTKIGRTTFAHSINGHRDAASTACPGRYLYARLGDIRTRAAALQAGNSTNPNTNTGGGTTNTPSNGTNLGNGAWTGATIRSTLTNRSYPDMVLLRAKDKRALVVPTGGMTNFSAARTISTGWSVKTDVQVVNDLTGDGKADLLYVTRSGVLQVRRGNGTTGFRGVVRAVPDFSGYLTPRVVGDLNGDGKNDLIAVKRSNRRVHLFLGNGDGTFRTGYALAAEMASYSRVYGVGDLTGDGKADLIGFKNGRMYLHRGSGTGRFWAGRMMSGAWGSYTDFATGTDFTGDGRPDVVARNSAGKLAVFPNKGNGTLGAPFGPTTTSVAGLTQISTAGNLAGGSGADLVGVAGDTLLVVPNADTYELGTPIDTGWNMPKADVVLNAGDWDLDGYGDLITRSKATGWLYLWRGIGGGKFNRGILLSKNFNTRSHFLVLGDVTGDKYPDLVATGSAGGVFVYPGNGTKGFKTRLAAPQGAIMKLPVSTSAYDWVFPIANLTKASTKADVVVREKSTGRIYVLEAASNYASRRLLSESGTSYTLP